MIQTNINASNKSGEDSSCLNTNSVFSCIQIHSTVRRVTEKSDFPPTIPSSDFPVPYKCIGCHKEMSDYNCYSCSKLIEHLIDY